MKTFFVRLSVSLALLGAVIFFVAPHVHPEDIHDALTALSWPLFLFALLLSLGVSMIKTERFHLLVRREGLKISFWESCKVFLSSQAASPLPAGETVRAFLLHKETRAGATRVAGPVVTQAIIELVAAVVIVMVGSLLYPSVRWIAFILFLLLVVILSFTMSSLVVTFMLQRTKRWKRIHNFLEKLSETQKGVSQILFDRDHKVPFFALSTIGLALLTNVAGGLLILFLSYKLGLHLNVLDTTYLYASSVAIQGLLGIIPGGLGVTEGGMFALLSLWRVPIGKAISLVAIFRIATLLFPVVLGLLLLTFFSSKRTLEKHYAS